ncbi:MAG TPA: ABC transporter ATP-binding protein [Streptosporangiaceae bacterium]|nr:ABC transporter ATP-binding protein [Streptosporangiaceae bacterium]
MTSAATNVAEAGTSQAVLQAREVRKDYGGLRAVADVSFEVAAGEVLGIAGPNGAGKTTLFDVITGHTRATAGEVLLAGQPITSEPVHVRARLGLARTFQQPTVARSLTVAENMLLAAAFGRPRAGNADRRDPRAVAAEFLEFVGLAGRAQLQSDLLGVYDRKSLMLGTALATGASAILLDEPFGGLSPAEIDRTIELIGAIRRRGLAVVCIEHVMRALTSIADRVMVMHHGAVFFTGTPTQMLADQKVVEVYLGARRERGQP